MPEEINDNEQARSATLSPGPYGQAALLLVESLIHGLVARSVITVADAVEIVEIAAEVKSDIANDMGDSPAALRKSLGLLETMAQSLRSDAG